MSNRVAGICWMMLGMFMFSALDAQTKYLSQHMPVLQVAWGRSFGMFIVVAVLLWPRHGLRILRTQQPVLQAVRGMMVLGSAVLFIVAINYIPLADAVAVTFFGPLIVTALGAMVLKEATDIRRWLVLLVGLGGTLVVIRPGLGVFQPESLLALAACTLFAFYQIVARVLGSSNDIRTTISWTSLVGAVIMTAVLPFVWVMPTDPLDIVMLAGLGLFAAGGEFCLIKAFTTAPVATVAPFQYTMMLWATFYGFTMFGDLPDLWTLIGAGILIATGLYSLYRDRA